MVWDDPYFLYHVNIPISEGLKVEEETVPIRVLCISVYPLGFPGGSNGKESAIIWENLVRCLGWDNPLEKGMATHSNILARRTPWTEEPGGLQSMGSQGVGHNWATLRERSTIHWSKLSPMNTFNFRRAWDIKSLARQPYAQLKCEGLI